MTRPSTGTSTGIFFPDLRSYQAFARQCAALIKQRILNLLFPASDTIHLLDGFPIPVCHACRGHRCRTFRGEAAWGYCATKKEHFYGLRGHLVITLAGTAVAFTVANVDERDVVPNLYDKIRGLLILLCYKIDCRGGCCWRRQHGQRGSRWTRPRIRCRRTEWIEVGSWRSGRTGASWPEGCG